MAEAVGTEAFVRFADVQKSYDGETLVIKSLNLDIEGGEFLTMLGPSGSGKTTCLMMLAGFETATYGEIFLDGRPINNVAPHRRDIGDGVPELRPLSSHDGAREPLPSPSRSARWARRRSTKGSRGPSTWWSSRASEAAVPPSSRAGSSSGWRSPRALVFEPKLVLMDEPLGALDKQLREQMQFEIRHIHERLGVTVVYVTHDQSEALTMSNRIAVFNDGVIQQLSTPEGLYERPENAFVAQFIGENNRLRGSVSERHGDTVRGHHRRGRGGEGARGELRGGG